MWSRIAHHFALPPRRRAVRPAVEQFDARIVPAQTDKWLGGQSADWGDRRNWDTNAVPVAGDTVILQAPVTGGSDPTLKADSLGLARLDADANFAGHTLTIVVPQGGISTTLEVKGDSNGVSGSWAGGTILLGDVTWLSVQGGKFSFSDGNLSDSASSGHVNIGHGATMVLGGTFQTLATDVYVGSDSSNNNGTTGTLESGTDLAAPVKFEKSGTASHSIVVNGTNSFLNIDTPQNNNDEGIKATSTTCTVTLESDGKETIGAGPALGGLNWTPKPLWSPAVATDNHGYGNLDCEYTQAAMHIQAIGAVSPNSVSLGDSGSTTSSSLHAGAGLDGHVRRQLHPVQGDCQLPVALDGDRHDHPERHVRRLRRELGRHHRVGRVGAMGDSEHRLRHDCQGQPLRHHQQRPRRRPRGRHDERHRHGNRRRHHVAHDQRHPAVDQPRAVAVRHGHVRQRHRLHAEYGDGRGQLAADLDHLGLRATGHGHRGVVVIPRHADRPHRGHDAR
jgi:hypothetical protein